MKDFNFLTHELEQIKVLVWGCCSAKHGKSQTLSCALEAIIRKCLCFQVKNCWTQIHDMLIDEDPLGQVKFLRLFKVTV